jgi:uncharacterized membrane protein YedE/YeeE
MNINHQDWTNALIGGLIIGIAVSLMLLWSGRVTGISGIINGTLNKTKGEFAWRLLFIAGLFIGGLTLKFIVPVPTPEPQLIKPQIISSNLGSDLWITIIAGLLVGFGTVMGSGCTSGHGICGLSRLSPRSIVATLSFIIAGAITVSLLKKLGVVP